MSFHMAVYETRAIKYKKEASKAQVRLEELMGEFYERKYEDQPRRKRPRTMGLKKALEKQKEEEDALLQSTPLTTFFTQEIENNRDAWPERVNDHLEKKLEKANKDFDLQRRMTGHYKKLNQFARRKLKVTQEKLKEAQRKGLEPKLRKDTSKIQILASSSQHVSENP